MTTCGAAGRDQIWGAVVHTVASKVIRAQPRRLMELYLDNAGWPRLYPATIRAVQLLGEEGGRTRLEVDHVSEGKVLNILSVISANEIRLDEWKPRYEATFINRFEAHPNGTRCSVFAEVALKGLTWLLTPVAAPFVRRRLHRHVLRPMKLRAEGELRGEGPSPPPARPLETQPR
jgi:hypothetical protein